MSNNVLTFYSVAVQQVNALESAIGKPDGEGVIEGDTPLGKIRARVNYHEPSGQLQVDVLEKPFLVSIHTIQAKIQNALNNAANKEAGLEELPPEPDPAPQAKKKGCKGCPDTKADAKSTESQAPAKSAPVESPKTPA